MKHKNQNITRTPARKARLIIASRILALLVLLALPASMLAAPIIVAINDLPNGAPQIAVVGAPNGFDIYTGDCVATPGVEDGALITLFGVDQAGSIPDWGGRFVAPNGPFPCFQGVDIVWVTHDNLDNCNLFGNNDLQVGFNSAYPGHYYRDPTPAPSGCFPSSDVNLGPVTDKWVRVYSSDALVILVDPHTYRLRN